MSNYLLVNCRTSQTHPIVSSCHSLVYPHEADFIECFNRRKPRRLCGVSAITSVIIGWYFMAVLRITVLDKKHFAFTVGPQRSGGYVSHRRLTLDTTDVSGRRWTCHAHPRWTAKSESGGKARLRKTQYINWLVHSTVKCSQT